MRGTGGDDRRSLTRMPPQGAIVAVLAIAGLASSFMFTLVVPIQSKLPELPELLDASREDTAWVVTSTLLAAAVMTPIAGRLGDMYGKRRIVLVLLALLVAGSVIAAVSPGIVGVVIGRTLQGAVTGVISPWGSPSCATCCTRTGWTPRSRSSARRSASAARSACRSAR